MANNITKTYGAAEHVTVKNGGTAKVSGKVILIGTSNCPVVLLKDATANEADVPAAIAGVEVFYDKLTTDDFTIGDTLYFDSTNDRLTLTSTANTKIGIATRATATSAAKGWVKLNQNTPA